MQEFYLQSFFAKNRVSKNKSYLAACFTCLFACKSAGPRSAPSQVDPNLPKDENARSELITLGVDANQADFLTKVMELDPQPTNRQDALQLLQLISVPEKTRFSNKVSDFIDYQATPVLKKKYDRVLGTDEKVNLKLRIDENDPRFFGRRVGVQDSVTRLLPCFQRITWCECVKKDTSGNMSTAGYIRGYFVRQDAGILGVNYELFAKDFSPMATSQAEAKISDLKEGTPLAASKAVIIGDVGQCQKAFDLRDDEVVNTPPLYGSMKSCYAAYVSVAPEKLVATGSKSQFSESISVSFKNSAPRGFRNHPISQTPGPLRSRYIGVDGTAQCDPGIKSGVVLGPFDISQDYNSYLPDDFQEFEKPDDFFEAYANMPLKFAIEWSKF